MNNINMNIQQISNNDILSVILINLNITDILSLRLTNLFKRNFLPYTFLLDISNIYLTK